MKQHVHSDMKLFCCVSYGKDVKDKSLRCKAL